MLATYYARYSFVCVEASFSQIEGDVRIYVRTREERTIRDKKKIVKLPKWDRPQRAEKPFQYTTYR